VVSSEQVHCSTGQNYNVQSRRTPAGLSIVALATGAKNATASELDTINGWLGSVVTGDHGFSCRHQAGLIISMSGVDRARHQTYLAIGWGREKPELLSKLVYPLPSVASGH
jgi:hypothetical protein